MDEEWFIVLCVDNDVHTAYPVGMYRTREEAINRANNLDAVQPTDDFDVYRVKEGDM